MPTGLRYAVQGCSPSSASRSVAGGSLREAFRVGSATLGIAMISRQSQERSPTGSCSVVAGWWTQADGILIGLHGIGEPRARMNPRALNLGLQRLKRLLYRVLGDLIRA